VRPSATGFVLALLVASGCAAPPAPASGAIVAGLAPSGPTETATVVSITDGDTIRLVIDGQEVRVRYIGIDTPEVGEGAEPFGVEATEANDRLVAGRSVVLERDVSHTDRFGRLLRHVWLETDAGWILVSRELLRLGLAQVVTFPPDVKYHADVLLPAQAAARDAGIGLWGSSP
jgi:micrococcal nuclease